jgi:hypothetical protein
MANNQPEEMSMQMSFMQHLDALRWHLVRSAIAIFIFAVGLFIPIPTFPIIFNVPSIVLFPDVKETAFSDVIPCHGVQLLF